MCGRFAASQSTEEIVEAFLIDEVVEPAVANFNVAPTDPIPAVIEREDKASGTVLRKLVAPRWGLVPSWAKDASSGARMINARVETVASKRAFAVPFARRRCLIPADGYFEWTTQTENGRTVKQPWFLHPARGRFVMAGLYEFWRHPLDGTWLTSATIITTVATDALGHIHDRMPMVVDPGDWGTWLDPRAVDADLARSLLSAPEGLVAHEVSRAVNSVANNGPEMIRPLEPPAGA
ncbi:MAG TPA: SOS response-associated peptidase [Propioniciclava sp.]|uniref:SOS response-associated peptidase n=1 Tax=Propioniciclava sp. TaxID=2038686 RepID=UPI002B941EBF|nr:SOS response-associated peptidase [Propioniciclava sp.]HRL81692.1 SOS response-associated peptidase [Propioniciclava sp.]